MTTPAASATIGPSGDQSGLPVSIVGYGATIYYLG